MSRCPNCKKECDINTEYKCKNCGEVFWRSKKLFEKYHKEHFKEKTTVQKALENLGPCISKEDTQLALQLIKDGNGDKALELITSIQKAQINKFKEDTGVDFKDIVPQVGKDIAWESILFHTFRVLDFDRTDTVIEENQVRATSVFKAYGYLIIESPMLNQKIKLPISHRDDFLLAASVFDNPKLMTVIEETGELLVTYAPKDLSILSKRIHALHYVITPRGTLDYYYSMNNDRHMAIPDPQKIFGEFVYEGELQVKIISEPEL